MISIVIWVKVKDMGGSFVIIWRQHALRLSERVSLEFLRLSPQNSRYKRNGWTRACRPLLLNMDTHQAFIIPENSKKYPRLPEHYNSLLRTLKSCSNRIPQCRPNIGILELHQPCLEILICLISSKRTTYHETRFLWLRSHKKSQNKASH